MATAKQASQESSPTPIGGDSSSIDTLEASLTAEANKLSIDFSQDEEPLDMAISSTASIASSLYEHVEENGRTYHKYKEGKYVLPNDEQEQNRLDLQHHIYKITLHDKLFLAPLKADKLKRALDFGTGTGIWAIEFAEKFPNTQVIGSDLSPIQPEFVPSNLSFEVDDMEDEWVYSHPFNYIHGRLMFLCLRDPLAIFRKAYAALSPGGYFEMQDSSAPLRSIDSSLEGTALLRCSQMITDTSLQRGIDLTAPSRFKALMEEAGFVDVKEVQVEMPIGTWAKSKHHKRIGALFQKDWSLVIEGLALGLFTRVLGMTRAEVEEFVKEVQADIADQRVHSYQVFYVVYGRKPE